MKSKLLHEVIDLVDRFQSDSHHYSADIHGFKLWVADGLEEREPMDGVAWEGKDDGRSPESVINTLLVHLNRYAKTYSKSAIYDSDFSTQEEFIYLINLKAFGAMSKMELIKKNVQDKPTGMQIINRLIAHGWIGQSDSETDGRSKIIKITKKGKTFLKRVGVGGLLGGGARHRDLNGCLVRHSYREQRVARICDRFSCGLRADEGIDVVQGRHPGLEGGVVGFLASAQSRLD